MQKRVRKKEIKKKANGERIRERWKAFFKFQGAEKQINLREKQSSQLRTSISLKLQSSTNDFFRLRGTLGTFRIRDAGIFVKIQIDPDRSNDTERFSTLRNESPLFPDRFHGARFRFDHDQPGQFATHAWETNSRKGHSRVLFPLVSLRPIVVCVRTSHVQLINRLAGSVV